MWLDGGPELLEPFRPLLDELPVLQPVVQDNARHRIDESHVSAVLLPEPQLREIRKLDGARIRHDQPRA